MSINGSFMSLHEILKPTDHAIIYRLLNSNPQLTSLDTYPLLSLRTLIQHLFVPTLRVVDL